MSIPSHLKHLSAIPVDQLLESLGNNNVGLVDTSYGTAGIVVGGLVVIVIVVVLVLWKKGCFKCLTFSKKKQTNVESNKDTIEEVLTAPLKRDYQI